MVLPRSVVFGSCCAGVLVSQLALGQPSSPGAAPASSSSAAPAGTGADSAPAPTPETTKDREQARLHFEQGITAYRQARYTEALHSFQKAWDLYPSPVFSFNLARTAEKLNDVGLALRHYRDYRRQVPEATDLAAVDESIRSLEAELARRGLQQVTILSRPEGATVLLDSAEVGRTPWTGEARMGLHQLGLRHPGTSDLDVELDLSTGKASDLTYTLKEREPEPSAPVAVAPAPAPKSTPPVKPVQPAREPSPAKVSTLTLLSLGASAATLGLTGVLELIRRDRESDVRELSVQIERHEANQSMENYQTAARVTLGVGLGLAAVGATLLVLDLSSGEEGEVPRSGQLALGLSELSYRGVW